MVPLVSDPIVQIGSRLTGNAQTVFAHDEVGSPTSFTDALALARRAAATRLAGGLVFFMFHLPGHATGSE